MFSFKKSNLHVSTVVGKPQKNHRVKCEIVYSISPCRDGDMRNEEKKVGVRRPILFT